MDRNYSPTTEPKRLAEKPDPRAQGPFVLGAHPYGVPNDGGVACVHHARTPSRTGT